MLPDRVSALPIALRGPARGYFKLTNKTKRQHDFNCYSPSFQYIDMTSCRVIYFLINCSKQSSGKMCFSEWIIN